MRYKARINYCDFDASANNTGDSFTCRDSAVWQPNQGASSRSSSPAPLRTLTSPLDDRSVISPVLVLAASASARTTVTFRRSYVPQASDENSHSACARSPVPSPRHPRSGFESSRPRTPFSTGLPTTPDLLLTEPPP